MADLTTFNHQWRALPELDLSLGPSPPPVLPVDRRQVWQSQWHCWQVAAVSSQRFDSLLRMFPEFHSCKRNMAAFILQREVLDTAGGPCQHYSVVALGSGQSSSSKRLCYNGTMVQDCNAIAIARRSLKRYLYKQLLVFFDPKSREGSIFERCVGSRYLQLKPKTYLHLYSNQLPDSCTQNLNFPRYSVGGVSLRLQYHIDGKEILSSSLDPSIWGAMVCCVMASSKLCRWEATGLQGGAAQPLHPSPLHYQHGGRAGFRSAGSKSHSAGDVCNIINKLLDGAWSQQLVAPYRKQDILVQWGDRVASVVPLESQQTLSLNWCVGDQEVEVLDGASGYIIDGSPSLSGPGFSSRLCKRALYSYFDYVAQRASFTFLMELPTYSQAKMDAHPYQRAKSVVNQQFNQAGPWQSKHMVDCFSL
ncbi:hypothetical protein CRUP_004172 [Coryphaenoides rupestris]|nr:hypothetical protein CRUP_004172 [Coryphaenoides rupestris]